MVDNISLRFDFLEKKKQLGHQFWNIPENKNERPKYFGCIIFMWNVGVVILKIVTGFVFQWTI